MTNFTHPTLYFESVETKLKDRLETLNKELAAKLKDCKLFLVPSYEFSGKYTGGIRRQRWRMGAFYAVLYIELPPQIELNLHLSEIERLAILELCQEEVPENNGYDIVDVRVVVPASGKFVTQIADETVFDEDTLAVIEAANDLIGNQNTVVKSKAVAILADLVEPIRDDLKLLFSDSNKNNKFSERLFHVFNKLNIRHYNLSTSTRLTNAELDFVFGVTLNLLVYYYSIKAHSSK